MEICKEQKIKNTSVSENWITILEKEDIIRYIYGYKFDLNSHATGEICDDKYALYEVLKHFNIKVAEHYIVFSDYDKSDIIEFSKKYNYDMVVKINNGTCGNNMFHTRNIIELIEAVNKLLERNFSIIICPYYKIKHEYRNIVLNENVELSYGKKRPIVKGDGNSSIYELLFKFNEKYFSTIEVAQELETILPNNDIYEYNWQFNLSKGSVLFLLDDNILEEKLKDITLQVLKVLNLKFASVDIIELETGELLVLEVNSGVMMENLIDLIEDGYNISKRIYELAIKEMFK